MRWRVRRKQSTGGETSSVVRKRETNILIILSTVLNTVLSTGDIIIEVGDNFIFRYSRTGGDLATAVLILVLHPQPTK